MKCYVFRVVGQFEKTAVTLPVPQYCGELVEGGYSQLKTGFDKLNLTSIF